MKRTLSGLVLIGVSVLLLIPFLALGQPPEIENPLEGVETIPELIEKLVNTAFWLAIIIAPLMILWGAFTFMTAAGDPQKVETGKKIIFWSIVGLAIILFSRGIISIIRAILS